MSKPKGFAGTGDAATRSRISSLGGKKAHAMGLAHKWNSSTAAEAGRLGGRVMQD